MLLPETYKRLCKEWESASREKQKSTLFTLTEPLKRSESVIALGKRLVEELGMEPGVDTLGRWMAHYVA